MLRRTSVLRRTVAGIAVLGVVALAVAACSKDATSPSSKKAASGRTLVVENNPQPNFTDTFNPFAATSTGKSQNALALFYEPLMQFNNPRPVRPTRGSPRASRGARTASRSRSRCATA